MAHSGTYLQRSRHDTTFYFRRRVPQDLVSCVGQTALYRTLETGDRREAIKRARVVAARTDAWFNFLRSDMASGKKRGDNKPLSVDWALSYAPSTRTLEFRPDEGDTPEGTQAGLAAFREAARGLDGSSHPGTLAAAPCRRPEISLRRLVDEFLATLKSSKTLRAYKTAFENHFLPYFGADTDIQEVDQDKFAAWVKEVLADHSRSHATKVGYVNPVTSMFAWRAATNSTTTPVLSTKRLIPAKETAASEERDPFEPAELATLFNNAARYKNAAPHKFWVTVCVAFMGCRVEELAQVDLRTDLNKLDGSDTWYLSIDDCVDADGVHRKGVKRLTSKRLIPIHSALVRHGLLEYFGAQTESGVSRPFERGWPPWIEPDKGEYLYSHSISKWGGRELKKLDKDRVLPRNGRKIVYFHSMRHAQNMHLAKRGVTGEARSALMGHQVAGGGENANRYLSLRADGPFLSRLVETHLRDYVAMLDTAVSQVTPTDAVSP